MGPKKNLETPPCRVVKLREINQKSCPARDKENRTMNENEKPTEQTPEKTPLQAAAEIVKDGYASASSGGKSVTNLSLADLDAHDAYMRKLSAAKSRKKGLGKISLGGGSPRE